MTINNGYQLWLFRDVDFQENAMAEQRQRARQLTTQFHKGSPTGDLEQAMKEPPSPHQLQFLMWTSCNKLTS